MEFAGLSGDDLGNVRALNRLFLDCLRRTPEDPGPRTQRAVPLHELIAALNEKQLSRLASSPFLLLSLREQDGDYWDGLFAADRNGELFAPRLVANDEFARLQVASLGFLWQLARRNAYAARVVSGASFYWCERLSEFTLVSLLARTAHRDDLLVPRFARDGEVWKKLLSAGVSAEAAIRSAAHLTAMQTMLTRTPSAAPNHLRAAACRMPTPRTR